MQRPRKPAVASRRPAWRKQLAANGIVMPRPREVSAYLRQHSDLAVVVATICAEARRQFGSATQLALEFTAIRKFPIPT